MSRSKTSHLVLVAFPAWGHVRPLLVLATKLLLERDDLVLTFILAPTMTDKAHSDLETHFGHEGLAQHRERIRVLTPFNTHLEEFNALKIMDEFVAAYPAIYQALFQEKPVTCAKKGTSFEAAPAPTAVVMDCLALGHLRATREISGNSVPVLAWLSCTASSTIRFAGPPEFGGMGDLGWRIDAEVPRTGKSKIEVGEQLFRTTNGNIINVAGIPPMYDHEYFPQPLDEEFIISALAEAGHLFFKESDGTIITTSEAYENPESVLAMRSWLSSWGKTMFGLGPLLPIEYGKASISSRGDGDTAVETFLEKSLQKYGEKSVLFISFGTIFWPRNPEYIEELIDSFIEKELPFLFCHASPFGTISEEVQKKVESSGLGLLTTWAPQQYVLTHKATGFFLTHGGHGGVTESLASGIPLIAWPFAVDQPLSVAQLTDYHKVAIELVEVRTGEHGLKPIRRLGDRVPAGTREAVGKEIREIIDLIRGPKGQEMAQNAARLKTVIAQHWEEGGVGKRELAAFLEKYVDSRVNFAA